MSALLVTLWPDPDPAAPRLVLAIEYRPPLRAVRAAPSNLRTPSIDAPSLAMLAALIDREDPR